MSCYIGEFHTVHYQQMLKSYAHHRILLCLLGKHEFIKLRRQYFLADNNDVMKENDYDESLKAEFDTEIQSKEFGPNRNISI